MTRTAILITAALLATACSSNETRSESSAKAVYEQFIDDMGSDTPAACERMTQAYHDDIADGKNCAGQLAMAVKLGQGLGIDPTKIRVDSVELDGDDATIGLSISGEPMDGDALMRWTGERWLVAGDA